MISIARLIQKLEIAGKEAQKRIVRIAVHLVATRTIFLPVCDHSK